MEAESPNSVMTPETSLRCWSYVWVILIASSEIITAITLGAKKIKTLTLKSAFNCT
jgi:hypothetical protein